MKPALTFWFDFASTYSYVTAMRIAALADKAGLGVTWQPFLLGPIFAAQGLKTSPFAANPVKGRYMWRDMQRLCAAEGLPLHMPATFPAHSLLAARIATALTDPRERAAFSMAVYDAEFGQGQDIADKAVLAGILAALGLSVAVVMAAAGSDEVKGALRAATDDAIAKGIFGAPTFITADGEVFWGNDRLDQAIAHARATA
jgi:2-hydroxychromene-2-carboxylate isomerase